MEHLAAEWEVSQNIAAPTFYIRQPFLKIRQSLLKPSEQGQKGEFWHFKINENSVEGTRNPLVGTGKIIYEDGGTDSKQNSAEKQGIL